MRNTNIPFICRQRLALSRNGTPRFWSLTTLLAVPLFSITAHAEPVVIPLSARVDAPRAGKGDGFCGNFAKATDAVGQIGSTTVAETVLDDTTKNRISFYTLVPIPDFYNGTAGVTGDSSFNNLFPWSPVGVNKRCTSPQPASPAPTISSDDNTALRLVGELNVTDPLKLAWTFGTKTDDGFSMYIGRNANRTKVMERPGQHPSTNDTVEVLFPQTGSYPVEFVYYEAAGAAIFEAYYADQIASLGNNGIFAAPFKLLTNDVVFLPTGAGAIQACNDRLGQPDLTCVAPPSTPLTCGNGKIDALPAPPANNQEECDDGQQGASLGCDANCKITPGYSCAGTPSVCTLAGAGGSSGAGGTGIGGNGAGATGGSAAGGSGGTGAAAGSNQGAAGSTAVAGAGGAGLAGAAGSNQGAAGSTAVAGAGGAGLAGAAGSNQGAAGSNAVAGAAGSDQGAAGSPSVAGAGGDQGSAGFPSAAGAGGNDQGTAGAMSVAGAGGIGTGGSSVVGTGGSVITGAGGSTNSPTNGSNELDGGAGCSVDPARLPRRTSPLTLALVAGAAAIVRRRQRRL